MKKEKKRKKKSLDFSFVIIHAMLGSIWRVVAEKA